MRKLVAVSLVLLIFACGAAQAAWVVDKSAQIPDVDKPGKGNNPNPARPGDNSCWQAAASNVLAAAGWGRDPTGVNTKQLKAENIYAQLNADLGIVNFGCAHNAINYWLYTYALNPAAGVDYQPGASNYTDVTVKTQFAPPLGVAEYNLVLNQLGRGQYVVVGFDVPPHCMTLVGGNPDNAAPPGGQNTQSIWHDSDADVGNLPGGGVDDDVYFNDFLHLADTPAWDLAVNAPGGPWHERIAQTYVVLCPGLKKPTYAMENYDAAFFMQDTDKDGNWDPGFRVAGTQAGVFGTPQWGGAGTNDENTITVQNQEISGKQKEIWLLIDYVDADWELDWAYTDPAGAPLPRPEDDIYVVDDQGNEYKNPVVTHSTDEGQLSYYWILNDQPAWEKIVFPDDRYRLLGDKADNDVKDWDLAVYCAQGDGMIIPEPAGLALMGLALLAWKRRRA